MGGGTDVPDHEGFSDCYYASYGRLTAQLNAYLGDATEAEDVLQEAFLRAWQQWEKISAYDDPVAWVRRVAWNLATSRWRSIMREAKLRRQRDRHTYGAELGPDNVALVAALRSLRPNVRRVIVLHYLADLPVAEIASDLGAPRNTVLSWLSRGRAELAVLLSDSGEPATGRV
jgi:RNA polymerase sigma-70 factor, ECF subfamily